MSNTQIDENLLKQANEVLANLMKKAETEKETNTGIIFNNNICEFKTNNEKISSDIIGIMSLSKKEIIKSKFEFYHLCETIASYIYSIIKMDKFNS